MDRRSSTWEEGPGCSGEGCPRKGMERLLCREGLSARQGIREISKQDLSAARHRGRRKENRKKIMKKKIKKYLC